MRLVADSPTAAWLEHLAGEPADFDWDAGNRTKNRKHGVSPGDVESMFSGALVFAGRIAEPRHAEPRWLVLGRNRANRNLALILTRRGNRVRAISCRAMRRNERRLYEEVTRENQKS